MFYIVLLHLPMMESANFLTKSTEDNSNFEMSHVEQEPWLYLIEAAEC